MRHGYFLLVLAITAQAADHGAKNADGTFTAPSPPCPKALFNQIYVRDQGWTLFEFSEISKSCVKRDTLKTLEPAPTVEAALGNTDYLAAHPDSKFLNRCLDNYA